MGAVQLTTASNIQPFTAFLRANGQRARPLIERARLPSGVLESGRMLVPTACIWRFRDLAARQLDLPELSWAVMSPLRMSGTPSKYSCKQATVLPPTHRAT